MASGSPSSHQQVRGEGGGGGGGELEAVSVLADAGEQQGDGGLLGQRIA